MQRIDGLIGNLMGDLMARNPNVAKNPTAQGMLDVVRSGDSGKGEQLALNLCESMGMTPDEAVGKARSFFGI